MRGKNATAAPPRVEGILPPERRRLGFLLMVTCFSLMLLSSSAELVHMVPLLSALGLGTTAALVGTVFGPSQVASRLKRQGQMMAARLILSPLAPFVLALAMANIGIPASLVITALLGCSRSRSRCSDSS
ncbi:hypothetical protein [Rhizobium phaseoli]|uniref:hypothetical protein n=1 Tax=Rhizobium phaseoli TaxID=396 RepID=UPI00315D1373